MTTHPDTYKPCLPKNVSLQRQGEHFLLIDPDTPNWLLSSALGALVLSCCNGQTTVADLTRMVATAQKVSYETARQTVSELLESVEKAAFVAALEKQKEPDREGNHLLIDLNLTHKCNLDCLHCYADAGDPLPSEMSGGEIHCLLDRLVTLNPSRVMFTGGEPLLREDLFELARHAKELGLATSLVTNGTLVNERKAAQIADCFDDVQVSLDGSTASLHERIRGKNTFDRTIQALHHLRAADVNVAIGTALTSLTLTDLPNIAQLALDLDIHALHVTPFMPWGRGVEHADLLPDTDAYICTAEAMYAQFGDQLQLDLLKAYLPARLKKKCSCGIGERYISVRANGDIYPCYAIHEPAFCAGNIRTHDVVDMYKESVAFKRCRETMVDTIETCKECSWRYLCGGGCRAAAMLTRGAFDAAPSARECELQKKVIERALWAPANLQKGETR